MTFLDTSHRQSATAEAYIIDCRGLGSYALPLILALGDAVVDQEIVFWVCESADDLPNATAFVPSAGVTYQWIWGDNHQTDPVPYVVFSSLFFYSSLFFIHQFLYQFLLLSFFLSDFQSFMMAQRHTYESEGSYDVTVKRVEGGVTRLLSYSVIIAEPSDCPLSGISGPQYVTVSEPVSYRLCGAEGQSQDSMEWDFGDGAVTTAPGDVARHA